MASTDGFRSALVETQIRKKKIRCTTILYSLARVLTTIPFNVHLKLTIWEYLPNIEPFPLWWQRLINTDIRDLSASIKEKSCSRPFHYVIKRNDKSFIIKKVPQNRFHSNVWWSAISHWPSATVLRKEEILKLLNCIGRNFKKKKERKMSEYINSRMLCFKWVWFGGSTCLGCWCGTMWLLKFVGRDIKQLEIPAFATEQRTSKQLWNAPINLNILVAPQVPLAHQKSPCKSRNSFSECINKALQRGEWNLSVVVIPYCYPYLYHKPHINTCW